MTEEKKLEKRQEKSTNPAEELLEDDWIGDIGDRGKVFREEMADVA